MGLPGLKTTSLLITGSGVGGGTGYGITQSYSSASEKNAVELTKAIYDLAIKELEENHKKAIANLTKEKDTVIRQQQESINKRDADGRHFFQQIEYINKDTTSPFNCAYLSHWRNMYRDNKWRFTYNGKQVDLKFQDWGCKKT